jgi:hypothetical protein
MDVDENGNMYVVELHWFILWIQQVWEKIKLLTDSDGDGIPDKATLFADHLRIANRHHAMEEKELSLWMFPKLFTSKIPTTMVKPT